MGYQISKDFEFAAAHHLPNLPEGHKCRRPHGHNYLLRVEVGSELLDARGFVLDYAELGFIADFIREDLDHRDLNEIFAFVPTAENLAAILYARIRAQIPEKMSLAVGLSETPKVWAWYRP